MTALNAMDGAPDIREFEYDRRFLCHRMPTEFDDGSAPTLIVQSYYVDSDNYALRVRLASHSLRIAMTPDIEAAAVLGEHQDDFTEGSVTVKGPSVGGTRYESEMPIDASIAAELIRRGGADIIKNRFSAWIGEDGWDIDIFGGANHPLVIAEAKRSKPVTNLIIPDFCVTEITDEARFSNDGLAAAPFSQWQDAFEQELASTGPHFEQIYGRNRMEQDERGAASK